MRNTSWHKVQPGQIIYFTYKSKHDEVGYPRTVLVINPKLRYRKKSTNRSKYYLVGLVLDTRISRGLTAGQLKKIFGRLGNIQVRDDNTFGPNLSEGQTPETTSMIYEQLQEFVNNYDIWRTFSLTECRKRRVYLEEKWSRISEKDLKKAVESAAEAVERIKISVDDAKKQSAEQAKKQAKAKQLKISRAKERERSEFTKEDMSRKFFRSVIEGLGG